MSDDGSKIGKPELALQKSDYVASAARAALGVVPFAGSLLAELAGTIIPNQRIDRIVRFAEALERRLGTLEETFVRSQLSDPAFSDLVEEGLRQAARSLSPERLEYIAAIITNGLADDEIDYQESKQLLRLLGEINDIEVIWLRFHLVPTIGGDDAYRETHRETLEPRMPTLGSPREDIDKAALQKSYKQHLAQLGLLSPQYDTDIRTKQPVYESSSGAQKIRSYRLTTLGDLLLRHIGITG